MDDLYPKEADHLNVIGHLAELRKRILLCFGALIVCFAIAFALGRDMVWLAKFPAEGLIGNLIFLAPEEAFVSYIKLSLLFGFMLCFPFILYQGWAFVSPAVQRNKQINIMVWVVLALILFISGILFSYYVALPAALKFLIYFGQDIATPAIAINKYISFFVAFMLIGGTVFEIPIIIGLLTDIGLLRTAVLRKHRRYAILVIVIIAAVITPTQDVVNLAVFSIPMFLLYEAGILIAGLIEK